MDLKQIIQNFNDGDWDDISPIFNRKTTTFLKFLKSANVTLGSTLELITYSFLIPIISDFQSAIVDGGDLQTIAMRITKRLVASGVVVVGQIALTDTIKKILKKFE